jgi:NAD(P)H-quinone oxidoreductase subunit I
VDGLKFERYGYGMAKGMAVTFKHLFRKWITTQYPEQKITVSRRLRGTDIIWEKESCIACSLCVSACPIGCIIMDTSRGDDKKLKVDYISIDFGLCIFCGLCVEACPTKKSLFMSYSYERTTYRCTNCDIREGLTPSDKRCKELLLENDELLETKVRKPSGYARPDIAAILPEQELLLEKTSYLEDYRNRKNK